MWPAIPLRESNQWPDGNVGGGDMAAGALRPRWSVRRRATGKQSPGGEQQGREHGSGVMRWAWHGRTEAGLDSGTY